MNPIFSRRIAVSASSLRLASDCPSRLTRPDVARSSPPSRLSSVDLPEPDGPTIDTIWPRGIATVTLSSATTSRRPSNCLHTLARSIIGERFTDVYRLRAPETAASKRVQRRRLAVDQVLAGLGD